MSTTFLGSYITSGATIYPQQITYNSGEPTVSKFETAFKIAQLMVDRAPLQPNDLQAFLALVKDIEAALAEKS